MSRDNQPTLSRPQPSSRRPNAPRTAGAALQFYSGAAPPICCAVDSPYYSGLADRLDGGGSIDVFVVVLIRPCVRLLGIVDDEPEARRMAADERSACQPAVGGR